MKKWLYRIEETFLAISIISATLILFTNIVLRYFFSANTTWAEEVIRYLMIWITFIGSSVCFGRGLHVGIDFFLDYVNKTWNAIIGLFVNIVCMLLMIFMTYYGFEMVQFSMSTGQITPSLRIEMYWVYLCIPVGAVLSLIHLLFNAIEQIKKFQSKSIEENQL